MTDLLTVVDVDPDMPDRIAVWSDYRLKDRVKAVPGAKWSPDHKRWHVPLSWPSCLALRAELGDGLRIEATLREWAAETKATKAAIAALRTSVSYAGLDPDTVAQIEPEHMRESMPGFKPLHPYQILGSYLIELAGDFLLFDEQGIGKGRTALAGLARIEANEEEIFPLMIVAPKSMLWTWRDECRKFFDQKIAICHGTPKQVQAGFDSGARIFILSYDALRRHSRLSPYPTVTLTDDEKKDGPIQGLGIVSLIADEVHRAKNPESKQTRALWYVAERATFRIGLTGTPIQDTPEDLWAVLHGLIPQEYGTKTSYVDRYLDAKIDRWGARQIDGLLPEHESEFLANLDTRMRRLTKEVAAPWLPAKEFEVRWVELPAKLRKAYESMKAKLVAELEPESAPESTLRAKSNLEKAGRLTQMANASGSVETVPSKDPDEPPKDEFHMMLPSPKIDAFMEDVTAGDFNGEQVVVFSDSAQLIRLLSTVMEKAKLPHALIDGTVTGDDREKARIAFQDGAVKFMLITRAGGEGITLNAASTMVRLVRPWSGIVHKQAEDRVHRLGSEVHDRIRIIDYLTLDTVEEGQLVRLNAKGERAQEVLRDEELAELLGAASVLAV